MVFIASGRLSTKWAMWSEQRRLKQVVFSVMAGLRWRHSSKWQSVEIVVSAGGQALSRSRQYILTIGVMHQVSTNGVEVLISTFAKAAKVFEVTWAVAASCAPTHSTFIEILVCPFSVP
jgi:hypothetical protein